MTRLQQTFLVLVMVQTVHSFEEYRGRLYDEFLPARIVSGLISSNLERGFIIGNLTLVAFGWWCFIWPVRRRWLVAAGLCWLWVAIELVNGMGHTGWSIVQGHYTPGVATAPLLFAVALYLAGQLRQDERERHCQPANPV